MNTRISMKKVWQISLTGLKGYRRVLSSVDYILNMADLLRVVNSWLRDIVQLLKDLQQSFPGAWEEEKNTIFVILTLNFISRECHQPCRSVRLIDDRTQIRIPSFHRAGLLTKLLWTWLWFGVALSPFVAFRCILNGASRFALDPVERGTSVVVPLSKTLDFSCRTNEQNTIRFGGKKQRIS